MLSLRAVCAAESEGLQQCLALHPVRMPSLSCALEVEKKAVGAGLQLLWRGQKLPLVVSEPALPWAMTCLSRRRWHDAWAAVELLPAKGITPSRLTEAPLPLATSYARPFAAARREMARLQATARCLC